MLIVIATDNGVEIKLGHFGDAKHYFIYQVDSENVNLIKKIPNPFRKEREYHHGEVRRRQGLINLFKMFGKVDAVVSTFLDLEVRNSFVNMEY